MPTIDYSIRNYLNKFLYKIEFEDSIALYYLTNEEDWKIIHREINKYYLEKYAKISSLMLTNLSPDYIEDFVCIINDYVEFLIKYSLNDQNEVKMFQVIIETTMEQLINNCLSIGYTRQSAYELSQLILNGINH